jgi:hypothetical protein
MVGLDSAVVGDTCVLYAFTSATGGCCCRHHQPLLLRAVNAAEPQQHGPTVATVVQDVCA